MKIRCLHPKHLTNPYNKQLVIAPCGWCSACLQHRSDQWKLKTQLEAQKSRFTLFVTLTYSEQFVPKFTVDELRSLLKESDVSKFDSSVLGSNSYFSVFNGYARIPLVKHLQDFIKRLRQNVYRCKNIPEPQKLLRYVGVSEYGETTYRPHYHLLLFTESEFLADNIEDFVSKAWSLYDKSTQLRVSIGRTSAEVVREDAYGYVASYLNCFSSLPKVLQLRSFRPFLISSRRPPIGSFNYSNQEIREIFDREVITHTIVQPETYQHVDVPFSYTFENALFPKCPGFDCLSHRERVALYGISSSVPDVDEFIAVLCSQWPLHCSPYPLYRLMGKALHTEFLPGSVEDSTEWPDSLIQSFNRILGISKRVRLSRSRIGYSLDEYVKSIEKYYSNKDYSCLKSQLLFEENYSNEFNTDASLSYLIGLIDESIFENERKLSSSTLELYKEQFHCVDGFKDYRQSSFFLLQKSRFDEFIFVGKSKKMNNEYLDSHPYLKTLHFN